jgi:anthranilate synthase/aminodeoxychorismate synthase-like glutamine amidotransferase
MTALDVLFIDNFDSFTFNLVDEFARRGCDVTVWRNTAAVDDALAHLARAERALVVLSPGPGCPDDAGCSLALARAAAQAGVPVFGVCLGLQVIAQAFGGQVGRLGEVVHGKTARISHHGEGLFAGLPDPMTVGRYHSLGITDPGDQLTITARAGAVPMAARHTHLPASGVQFHPESILTRDGGALIDNVIRAALAHQGADQ